MSERYNIKWKGDMAVFSGLHYGPGILLMAVWIAIFYGIFRAPKISLKKTG